MARTRTEDDSVTYWFPWKHPRARRRGLEFGVFDQTPPQMGSSARPYGPRPSIFFPPQNCNSHLPLSAPLLENTTQIWARPCGPRLWSVANAPGANFVAPSTSASRFRTCCARLRPRRVYSRDQRFSVWPERQDDVTGQHGT